MSRNNESFEFNTRPETKPLTIDTDLYANWGSPRNERPMNANRYLSEAQVHEDTNGTGYIEFRTPEEIRDRTKFFDTIASLDPALADVVKSQVREVTVAVMYGKSLADGRADDPQSPEFDAKEMDLVRKVWSSFDSSLQYSLKRDFEDGRTSGEKYPSQIDLFQSQFFKAFERLERERINFETTAGK
jgi:hypothetical protein